VYIVYAGKNVNAIAWSLVGVEFFFGKKGPREYCTEIIMKLRLP
jgi:hypothetical protein